MITDLERPPPAPPVPGGTEVGGLPGRAWRGYLRWWSRLPASPAASGSSSWPRPLKVAWRVSGALLVLQLAALFAWSAVLVGRFALTQDFSTYNQAMSLLAGGRFDPFSTVHDYPFWRDHAVFIAWPLALVYRVFPHPLTLTWMQDAAVVAGEGLALRWLFELAAARAAAVRAGVLAALGLGTALVLVTSPWVVWACSFDVHAEVFSAALAIGAARALYQRRRSYPLWALAALLSGDVGTTYLLATGLAAVVVRRDVARRGALTALAACCWMALVAALHGDLGTPLDNYVALAANPHPSSIADLLRGALTHPGAALSALRRNALDLYANVSQGGLAGLADVPLAAPAWLALIESGVGSANGFAEPGFQNVAVSIVLPAASAAALLVALAASGRWSRRWRRAAGAAGVLLLANAGCWAAAFLPRTASTWLRVSPAAARTLADLSRRIAPTDEVIAWQGVSGAFSGRRYAYPVVSTGTVPLRTPRVWVIVAPAQGVETVTALDAEAEVARLESTPNARLITSRAGIWAFLLERRPGERVLDVTPSRPGQPIPAWDTPGSSGTPIEQGPARDWYVASTAKPGYVVSGTYWREPPGSYTATVRLSTTAPVDVELWDATTSVLLARDTVPATDGPAAVSLTGALAREVGDSQTLGWGIWRYRTATPAQDSLEVRVWSPGALAGAEVAVYSLALAPAPKP